MKAREELKEFRTPNSKRFLNKDGTIQVELYKEPIHYKNDDGQYEEIDNTFEETTTGLKNKKNDFFVEFDEKNENSLLNISSKGHKLCMYPKKIKGKQRDKKSTKGTKKRRIDRVKYEGILENTDIEYELRPKCLKESIVLHEKPKNNIIEFILKTDLELSVNTDNSIYISNGKETLFKLEKPFMIDNKKSYSESIKYEIEKNKNEYEIRMVLDKEWINSKDREYPIIIDPTISTVSENLGIIDTTIYENDSYSPTPEHHRLNIGYNASNVISRSLLKFQLPKLPAGYRMEQAILRLYSHPLIGELEPNFERKVVVHALNKDWTEDSATWSTMSEAYDNTIYDYIIGQNSYASSDGINEIRENNINITNLVDRWYNNKIPNYGLLLKWDNESASENGNSLSLLSKESIDYLNNGDYIPKIEITYKDCNGIENYMSYTTLEHHFGNIYINNNTGNLTAKFNVGEINTLNMPVNLELVYNTKDIINNKNYGFGIGFKPSLYRELKITSNELIEYLDEDGTTHFFHKNDDDTFYDEDGLSLKIELLNGQYILKDQNGNTSTFEQFNNIYRLNKITSKNNKNVIIQYNQDGKLNKILNEVNEEIVVNYIDSKIHIISPFLTTIVNIENGLLKSIISLEDEEIIAYNTNNLINSIINPNELKLNFEYLNDTSYKIKKVSEISRNGNFGKSLSYEYDHHSTKITDNTGYSNTYIFNAYGNTVGITSIDASNELKKAYGKSYSFGSEEQSLVNKMTADKSLVGYIENHLKDSSFENENDNFITYGEISKNYISESRSGQRALKLECINPNGGIYQNISIPHEGYYTFSLYAKNNIPFNIKLIQNQKEESINITTLNDNYNRFFVTMNCVSTEELTLRVEIEEVGYVIIDDIQFEEGKIANYYNLVENSSFEDGLYSWEYYTSAEGNANVEVVNISENKVKALRITSNPLDSITVRKNFNISGKAGDVFNLSFWYKNEGIIPTGYSGGIDGQSIMASIFFDYGEDYEAGTGVPFIKLNEMCDNWQFFSENFSAEADYNNIELRIMSIENANNCYLTNFSLFKDIEQYSFVYDDVGNLISTIDLNKKQDTLHYDNNNQLTQLVKPLGANYIFEYDNANTNRIIRAISPSGIINRIIYDSNGNPTKVIISNKKTLNNIDSTRKYHIRGKGTNKFIYINPNKTLRLKENECSSDNFILEQISENNYKIKHAILNNYYVKEKNGEIIIEYGDSENTFEILKNYNHSISFKSNISNKVISITNEFQLTLKEYEENNYQQEFYLEDSNRKETIEYSAEYTSDGKYLLKTHDSLNNTTQYNMNPNSGLLESVIDSNGIFTNYTYDNKKRLKTVTKSNKNVSYEYSNNNLSNITFGNNVYKYYYDEFNNISNFKINNNDMINYIYESNNGNLNKKIYGNNQELNYTYDLYNRINTIEKNDDIYTYYYDNLGRIVKIYSNETKKDYEYDFVKRLSKFKNNNYEVEFEYDEENKVVQKTQKYGNDKYISNYTYNDENVITTINISNKNFNFIYDDLGRLIEKNINGNCKIKYNYKKMGNKTSTVLDTLEDKEIFKYEYDKLGNIVKILKNNTIEFENTYDEHSQIISQIDYTNNKRYELNYDNQGNIITNKVYELDSNILIGEDDYVYGNGNWQDLLTRFNNEDITYDSIGNPLSIGSKQFTWINGRELSNYNDENNTITYKYDENGYRVSKNINGSLTTYFLEGNKIIFENRNQNMIYYIYEGDRLLGFKYQDVIYYYHKNIFEDIIGIFDENYEEIVKYEYDMWGKIIDIEDNSNINISTINPFRYRSYYYDNETNLYCVGRRYYNPLIKRFINRDNLDVLEATIVSLTDLNLFSYCDNNPIMRTDISGEFWDTVIDVFSFGASIVEVAKNPIDPWAWATLGMDTVDVVVPFVSGTGEITRSVKILKNVENSKEVITTVKKVDKADDVLDSAKALYKSDDFAKIKKTKGSYEIKFSNGKNYVGKGDFNRAMISGKTKSIKYNTEVEAILWKSAPTNRDAFIDEYWAQKKYAGIQKFNNGSNINTYNQIWSPGKRIIGD